MEKKTWSAYKTYLAIASLTWLIWGVISLWIALTSLGERIIITNQEYVDWDRYYAIDQCSDWYYKWSEAERKTLSPEEIKECEEEQRTRLILARNVRTKESVFGGIIRAILFSALFFTHYPKFKKSDK